MALKPQTLTQWATAIGTAVAALTAAGYAIYTFGLKTDTFVGKLEKQNRVLAEQHIGEQPISITTVLDEDTDFIVVNVYENGDSSLVRRYEDPNGNMKRFISWSTKRSIESILEIETFNPEFISSAYADSVTKPSGKANKVTKEVYIGRTGEGFFVYRVEFLKIPTICIVVDETTGEIIDDKMKPPCEKLLGK